MKVIFLEDIPNLAKAGDVRNVKDGYARNYLLPKKLASIATAEDMKLIEGIKRAGDQRRVKETVRWQDLANALDGTSITLKAKVTPMGQFYGAVTPGQIAQELSVVLERDIDRKLVEVIDPIKEPGEYEVALHLAPDIQATIFITAESED